MTTLESHYQDFITQLFPKGGLPPSQSACLRGAFFAGALVSMTLVATAALEPKAEGTAQIKAVYEEAVGTCREMADRYRKSD